MARYRQRKRLMAEINVVPYIDVMLVLLIIFMITAPMMNLTQGLEVDVPQARNSKDSSTTDNPPIFIGIDARGQLFLSYLGHPTQAIDLQSLLARITALVQQNPQRLVVVLGDKNTAYQHVVNIIDSLQAAGITRIVFKTQNYEQP